MGAIATFSYQAWKARYPEFGTVSQDLADAYFAEATLYLRNDGTGPVQDAGQQLVLLNMLVAHIASISALNDDGTAANSLVGPITGASEGSVSVSTALQLEPGSAAWFQTSKYGYQFWAATAAYRSMRYVPSRAAYSTGYGGWARRW